MFNMLIQPHRKAFYRPIAMYSELEDLLVQGENKVGFGEVLGIVELRPVTLVSESEDLLLDGR
jgi:hypothetical protein